MDKRRNNGGNSTKAKGSDKRRNEYRKALEVASKTVDKVSIEMVTANEKDIGFLKQELAELKSKEGIDISDLEEALAYSKTQTMVLSKEIELLKIQIEEIKVSTSNPLTN